MQKMTGKDVMESYYTAVQACGKNVPSLSEIYDGVAAILNERFLVPKEAKKEDLQTPKEITAQYIHDTFNKRALMKKKEDPWRRILAFEEISTEAREAYEFVAEQLNKNVVVPLQKEIENQDAVHHNLMGHGEAMYNEQCQKIAALQAKVQTLQGLLWDWKLWAAARLENTQPLDDSVWMNRYDELAEQAKALLGEEEAKG